ncbi:hypothetical protein RD792_002719 [Penstemon davidsonii]|uniref:Protein DETOXIFICATION n=1 Tax=Penstemon davidsonii TaxID=160366 RepID=A0ABR0DRT7_9LAMI|nr:hypothetical protein RD792_002719 [Penstemon davidsonii]
MKQSEDELNQHESSNATTHSSSVDLENILSDTDLPCLNRLQKATWIELKLLFKLAGPSVMMYLINNSMSMSTRIFSGHLGNLEFAAACLGNQGIQLFAYGLLRGGNFVWAGVRCRSLRHAWRVPPTRHCGADPVQPPNHGGVRALTAAASPPRRIQTGGDVSVRIRVRLDSSDIRVRSEFSNTEVSPVAEHSGAERVDLSLDAGGAPVDELGCGVQDWIRVDWSFLGAELVVVDNSFGAVWVLVLVAGLLENPELSLDALSVCMSVNGLMFMVSVGFNAAASVRVSNEIGAGHPKSAAFSVVVVNSVSFVVAVVEAMVVLSQRHVISYIFTGGETVANAVADLCPFLAVTLILNGVQPVLSGVAVGCGWQAFVAYVNVGCYYVVGIPIGCILGFKYNLGVKGIWSGMIGGTMMQTLILLWVTFRTDWNKEV